MLSVIDDLDPDAALEDTAPAEPKKTKKKKKKKAAEPEEDEGCTFHDGQLSCAGQDWTEMPRWVAERYGKKSRRVDLCYNELTSLKHVEQFQSCEELVLDNNALGDDVVFPAIPGLLTLTLNKNRIADTEKLLLEIKQCYPKLRFLSLLGNEACPNELVLKDEDDYKRYRYFVPYHLPGLKFLDSRATSAHELAEAQRVGQFMKVVTVTKDEMYAAQMDSIEPKGSQFSPLPSEGRDAESHRGTIGTCKYVYYGKHSEGNRFIRNNDL